VTPIVFVTGRYQLGNDPGVFQDAIYVGHELSLPFKSIWIDPAAASIGLTFYTHDVETWAEWQGHRVAINGTEIGRLKDPDDKQGVNEVFHLSIARHDLEQALNGKDTFLLTITLGELDTAPNLSDDFVLWRIESDGSFAAHLGWK
jgi:hypothetical protein